DHRPRGEGHRHRRVRVRPDLAGARSVRALHRRTAAGLRGNMPIEVLMPALSPTMTEGKVAKWLKHEGDAVKSGQVLAEIETDKAPREPERGDEGPLGKILVRDGTEGVKVNTPIGVILEGGEKASATAGAAKAAPAAAPAPAAPAVQTAPARAAAPP